MKRDHTEHTVDCNPNNCDISVTDMRAMRHARFALAYSTPQRGQFNINWMTTTDRNGLPTYDEEADWILNSPEGLTFQEWMESDRR